MTPRPLCRYCGKPIPKRVTTVRFGCGDVEMALQNDWCRHRRETPRTKDEARALVNEQIVSFKWTRGEEVWAKEAGGDYIKSVGVWDGESYVDRFFCNGDHARLFAYACVQIKDRPLAMDAYWDALKKQAAD